MYVKQVGRCLPSVKNIPYNTHTHTKCIKNGDAEALVIQAHGTCHSSLNVEK
jgi:hypothetical protein